MEEAIIGKKYIILDDKKGTGCFVDKEDARDLPYDEMALGAPAVDWTKGYDVERELGIKVKIKNQDGSSSCVGQGFSYYAGVINSAEIGHYIEISAKGFYSQIALPGGGAYIRDGAKLLVNWGALLEIVLASYDGGNPPTEKFMLDKSWITPELVRTAQTLQGKEYRTITAASNMDMFASAIQNNLGVVGGVSGSNNNTWGGNEPKAPKSGESTWGHCLYFGKFGVDSLGKFISTPNSWGERKIDDLHRDGWQKFREDYFNDKFMFNPWTITDKPNFSMSPETQKIVEQNEKKVIIESEGIGRKGIIIGGKLRSISKDRAAEACLYTLANNKLGSFVSSRQFDEMIKGDNF